MERLMEIGAKDAFYTPIYMKKNRPAYKLSVLCAKEDRMKMEEVIFMHSTAIGIRRTLMERTVLERKILNVETEYGAVRVKCATYKEENYYTPEYEDLKKILETHPVSYQHLYNLVMREAERKL